jgi:general secretion pathway protein G
MTPELAQARLGSLGGVGSARAGFTLLELMIVIAVIATLASIGAIRYSSSLQTARNMVVEREMSRIQDEIDLFELRNGTLPLTLADLELPDTTDPWGNPYQYLNFSTIKGKGNGQKRKDKFIVPLNSTYDFYSMGPDGKTAAPLTAQASRDDIVRANDGDYLGPAADY